MYTVMRRASYGKNDLSGVKRMPKVHICTAHGTVKVDASNLDTKVRLAWAVELMESWHKPKAQPVAKPVPLTPVQLCGRAAVSSYACSTARYVPRKRR